MSNSEWTPKYSYQTQKEHNCGQHCVAMITGLPVSVISFELGNNRGTHTHEIARMLWWFGIEADRELTRFKKGMRLPDLCIIHVRHHWAIFFRDIREEEFIYCSNTGIWPDIKRYGKIKSFLTIQKPKHDS